MSEIDKELDLILKRLCMDYTTNYNDLFGDWILMTQATDHNKAVAKELINRLIESEVVKELKILSEMQRITKKTSIAYLTKDGETYIKDRINSLEENR